MYALVLREMQGRFGTLRMGPVFTVLEPALHILGFTILYGLLHDGTVAGVEYPVFLLIGMVPFLLFRNVALQLMESLEANRALFSYRQIQPFDTFVARVLVEFTLAATVFSMLFLGFLWYGLHITIENPVEWIMAILLGIVFSFGVGCIFAAVAQAMPQAKILMRLSFFPLYFLSSVLFLPSRFPAESMPYLLWNPYFHIVELIREGAIPNYPIAYGVSANFVIRSTLVSLFLGLGLYRARRLAMMRL